MDPAHLAVTGRFDRAVRGPAFADYAVAAAVQYQDERKTVPEFGLQPG